MSKSRSTISSSRVAPVTAEGTSSRLSSDRVMNLVAAALLTAALVTLYARVANAPFIFDDEEAVQTNTAIRTLWPLWGDAVHRGPLNPEGQLPTSGRPLANLSFALNYACGGLQPAGYRWVNVAIHSLSAMLLMLIVRRTLRMERFAGRFDRAAGPLALLVALAWAVHPLQTEPVAYVTQRTELLMALWYLATLYCALRYWALEDEASRRVRNTNKRNRTAWLALAACASAAGMASKEVMVTVPLVVCLYEWTFRSRSLREIGRNSWPLYAGLVATWLLLLYLNVGGPRSVSTGFQASFTAWTWWSTQAKVFWMYLKLAVWPWPLMIHYNVPLLDTWQAAWPWVFATVLILTGTFALLIYRHPVGFVAASVMVILSPTSIVPILTEFAAERRMYLPLAPLLALAIAGGYLLSRRFIESRAADRAPAARRPLVAVTIAALLLTTAGFLVSARRLNAYAEVIPLWEDALVHEPDDFFVNYNLAACYLTNERVEEALEAARRTVQKWPDKWRARMLMGKVLSRNAQTDEAIASFQKSVELQPQSFEAQIELGNALSNAGRYQEAIAHLEAASQLKPYDARPQYLWGLALSKAGKLPEAVDRYQSALTLDAYHAATHSNLGVALAKLDRIDEAMAQIQRAVELDPNDVDAQKNLARLLDHVGKISAAINHYEAALRIQPKDFEIHSKLTEAYVRNNQPAKAIAIAEKAAELAQAAGQANAAAQIQSWLRDFRAKQSAANVAPRSTIQ